VLLASIHLRNKKRARLIGNINELSIHSKNESIRDLYRRKNSFKKGYQPRKNLVKDEKGDLLADYRDVLNRGNNYFPQLFNVHRISDVRQTEIHTAELLVP
jgi:hypothetical protein